MPIPVSVMSNFSRNPGSSRRRHVTRSTTVPSSVNLIAFVSRFTRICRSRPSSPCRMNGTSGAMIAANSSPFPSARGASNSITPSVSARKSKSCGSSFSCADSIFEKSNMSLMISSSASPLLCTASTNSRCRDSSFVSSSRPDIPMIAFIGVRISWLITARKSLFALFAASAASFARTSSAAERLLSVMSEAIPTEPVNCPCSSNRHVTESCTGKRVPSLRIYVHSRSSGRPSRAFATIASKPGRISRPSSRVSSAARATTSTASWINSGVAFPTTSSARYPSISSAAELNVKNTPCGSTDVIA